MDVNHSRWDCALKYGEHDSTQLRLGMRLIKGLRQNQADAIAGAVESQGSFQSVESLWRTSGVAVASLRKLASADAFGSMQLDRQAALWQIRALRDDRLPLFEQANMSDELEVQDDPTFTALPRISLPRQVVHDYASVGLSLKAHPISFIRPWLNEKKVTPSGQLRDERLWAHGAPVTVAGLVLVRQRPGTASGVVFVTMEDETGVANLIIRPRVFERDRRHARRATVMLARGRIERQGQVVHVMVTQVEDVSFAVTELIARSRDFH